VLFSGRYALCAEQYRCDSLCRVSDGRAEDEDPATKA